MAMNEQTPERGVAFELWDDGPEPDAEALANAVEANLRHLFPKLMIRRMELGPEGAWG